MYGVQFYKTDHEKTVWLYCNIKGFKTSPLGRHSKNRLLTNIFMRRSFEYKSESHPYMYKFTYTSTTRFLCTDFLIIQKHLRFT